MIMKKDEKQNASYGGINTFYSRGPVTLRFINICFLTFYLTVEPEKQTLLDISINTQPTVASETIEVMFFSRLLSKYYS